VGGRGGDGAREGGEGRGVVTVHGASPPARGIEAKGRGGGGIREGGGIRGGGGSSLPLLL